MRRYIKPTHTKDVDLQALKSECPDCLEYVRSMLHGLTLLIAVFHLYNIQK